jgi:cyclic pyranopterin phosphate synthase
MPRELFGSAHRYLPREQILSFEEITRVAREAAALGVRKLRLTGGEPLLRTELPVLVEMLATLPVDLALTTNGILLEKLAEPLARAGLRRVTVSLDALDEPTFQAMSDSKASPHAVLRGIDAALRAGLSPIKVNSVIRRGVNEHSILDLARHFRGAGITVRFIEYMDVGSTNGWREADVVPASEILARIGAELPLEPLDRAPAGEVAARHAYLDGSGEVGVIASVSRPFCGACTRARLSADGHLYTCLFATRGTDLRPLLRGSASDTPLRELLAQVWRGRDDRYSEIRALTPPKRRIEMSYIGG